MKKTLLLLMALLAGLSAWAIEQDSDGNYLIGSAEDLTEFLTLVNGGYNTISGIVTADIEMSGSWQGIGINEYNFNGTFDGQGHKISGFTSGYGLFGYIGSDGTVKRVIVDGQISTNGDAGGIATSNNGHISRCGFIGTVSGGGSTNSGDVGGICGSNGGTIEFCYNQGSVSGRYVGGIVGYNLNRGTVRYCYNCGSLRMDPIKYSSAIIGHYFGSASNCYTLDGSANHHGSEGYAGTVMSAAQFAGGEVCYLLQKDFSDEQIWGQLLGTDNAPLLTDDAASHVYKLTETSYTNNEGEPSSLSIPYVAWCADSGTLYFFASNEILKAGDTHDGQTITSLWMMDKVTATDNYGEPGWSSVAASVVKAVFEESFANVKPTILRAWFWYFNNLAEISGLEYLDTSEATTLRSMFGNCGLLTVLDLSNFNTTNVTQTYQMFLNCSSLKTIYVSDSWDMTNVGDSKNMFAGCTSLVGGDGTVFDSNYVDKAKAYAGEGGYLTNNTPHAITVPETENGTVVADKATAAVGETVTLTITPNNGYELETLTVTTIDSNMKEGAPLLAPHRANVDVTPSENNTYTFLMPMSPVVINATFKETSITGIIELDSDNAKSGQRYNILGQPVDENYKGIVIQDGHKILVK